MAQISVPTQVTQPLSSSDDTSSFRPSNIYDSPRTNPPDVPPSLVSLPDNTNEFVDLETRESQLNGEERRRYDLIKHYVRSGLVTGRHLNRAIVLVLGVSGHGKSKTINSLVGREIFAVAKTSDGSITEVVQRTSVKSINPKTGVSVTVSFDDTPGLEDSKIEKREQNAALMRDYGNKYYPTVPRVFTNDRGKTYPNLIVLVASWDSVKRDDNEPAEFTSSIGRTMYYLSHAGLYDDQYQNVVVVVTKALTFWSDYDELDSEIEKNQQWKRDADGKAQIINNLRSKMFPSSKTWRVVFVENGGGKKISQTHRMLPNGEQSHQNLFDAILEIFTEAEDLVGSLALQPLAGAPNDSSRPEPTEREILCQRSDSETSREKDVEAHKLAAKARLGHAYNPLLKRFSPTPIVDFNTDIDINFRPFRQHEPIADANNVTKRSSPLARLRAILKARTHNPSTVTSISPTSQSFESTVVTATATFSATLTPSGPMRGDINNLPPWDELSKDVKAQYRRFFEKHGTHINVQTVLGGIMRITSHDNIDEGQKMVLSGKADAPVVAVRRMDVGATAPRTSGTERRSTSSSDSITLSLEGGSTFTSDLTRILKDLFGHGFTQGSIQNWIDIRARWVDALQTNPGFCADHKDNQYEWLFKIAEITSKQQKYLQRASEWYLWRTAKDEEPDSRDGHSELLRNNNMQAAIDAHDRILAIWKERLKQWLNNRADDSRNPRRRTSN